METNKPTQESTEKFYTGLAMAVVVPIVVAILLGLLGLLLVG